jgi:hypothetical protein
MCYESLVDEDEAIEKPLAQLVREETGSAVTDAGIATTAVVAMLLVAGTPLWLVGATALVTPVLTLLLHQAVLIAGVSVVRWRATPDTPTPDAA